MVVGVCVKMGQLINGIVFTSANTRPIKAESVALKIKPTYLRTSFSILLYSIFLWAGLGLVCQCGLSVNAKMSRITEMTNIVCSYFNENLNSEVILNINSGWLIFSALYDEVMMCPRHELQKNPPRLVIQTTL
jgi:hypothetical protein